MLVDAEVVDHGLHGERHGPLHLPLGVAHDGLQALLGPGLAIRVEEEAHAAARHAAEHPEAPEGVSHFGAHLLDEGTGVQVPGPGNDGLDGAVEVALGRGADAVDVALLQLSQDFIQNADGFAPALPLRLGAQQVLLGHHLEDGSDVLRHPAVNQDQALLELVACFPGDLLRAEYLVVGKKTPAADAEFRVGLHGADSMDELDSGPHAARVLPASARSGQPLAQDGARCHETTLVFLQSAGECMNLAGGPHAYRNE